MKVHVVSLGLGLAAGASPAFANVELGAAAGPHHFSVNNELGVYDSTTATSLRDSVLFALRVGHTFTPMLGVEAELGVIPTEARDLVFDVWTLTFRAHVIAQHGADDPSARWIPFGVAGVGAITVTSSDNLDLIYEDTDELFYVGAGVKYRVDNGWGLRADARLIAVPSSELTAPDPDGESVPLGADYELLFSVYKEWGRAAPAKPPEPVAARDRDGDGLLDEQDGCPDDPEDLDGFQDGDGCPDPDNDGLLDVKDACPDEPEDPDGHQDEDGCPDPDNDGDGVPDASDQCPEQKETPNGYEDDDGCPDDVPKALKQFTGVIKGINFETNSDEIKRSSFKVLDKAVKILADHPDTRIEIQGHTDDVGDHGYNLDLSQRRAESVKRYLVGKGIDEARLEAKGYGPDVPLVNKKTRAARAKNRRVEFKLISALEAPPSQ